MILQKNKNFKDFLIFILAITFISTKTIKSYYMKRISLGLIDWQWKVEIELYMSPNILITGSNGFIAKNIINVLGTKYNIFKISKLQV